MSATRVHAIYCRRDGPVFWALIEAGWVAYLVPNCDFALMEPPHGED